MLIFTSFATMVDDNDGDDDNNDDEDDRLAVRLLHLLRTPC